MSFLPFYLAGHAIEVLNSLSNYKKLQIEQFLKGSRAFKMNKLTIYFALESTAQKWRPKESVADFAADIQRIARSAFKLEGKEAISFLGSPHAVLWWWHIMAWSNGVLINTEHWAALRLLQPENYKRIRNAWVGDPMPTSSNFGDAPNGGSIFELLWRKSIICLQIFAQSSTTMHDSVFDQGPNSENYINLI